MYQQSPVLEAKATHKCKHTKTTRTNKQKLGKKKYSGTTKSCYMNQKKHIKQRKLGNRWGFFSTKNLKSKTQKKPTQKKGQKSTVLGKRHKPWILPKARKGIKILS